MKSLLTTVIILLISFVSFGQKHTDWKLNTTHLDVKETYARNGKVDSGTNATIFIKQGDSVYIKNGNGLGMWRDIQEYASDSTYILSGNLTLNYYPKRKTVKIYWPQGYQTRYY